MVQQETERERSGEIPSGLVPVYHETHLNMIPSILADGLTPGHVSKRGEPYARNRASMDYIFDNLVGVDRKGFTRTNSVYAYHEYRHIFNSGEAMIRLVVHPQEALVTDMSFVDEALLGYRQKRMETVIYYARLYWERAMLLGDYLKGRKNEFAFPEVLIPERVIPDRITLLEAVAS